VLGISCLPVPLLRPAPALLSIGRLPCTVENLPHSILGGDLRGLRKELGHSIWCPNGQPREEAAEDAI
jgi:hypothetical protein